MTLESFVMDGQHVAVTPEGEMKSASDATKDFDAQFTVKLIVSGAICFSDTEFLSTK